MEKFKKCIICKTNYLGWGNNAQPIKEGQCCDNCNSTKVIPTRIAVVLGRKN